MQGRSPNVRPSPREMRTSHQEMQAWGGDERRNETDEVVVPENKRMPACER